jgi:hypothetical protein
MWGGLSLTRGQICRLQLLLVLASPVIFGSESPGTCDHILLSQIRDFPFRRLLKLAGALSDERTGPSFSRVTVRSSVSLLSVCTIYILHVIKRMYICMYKCMYIQYIQGLCQSRLSTADHALLLIASATTAVYSLERSYA